MQTPAAIDLLKQQIKEDPRPVPAHPPYPDKRSSISSDCETSEARDENTSHRLSIALD